MSKGFRKILCPIDFSENCDRAAEHAAWFAHTSLGEVYLVHVVANPAEPIYSPQDVTYWALVKHAEEKAAELLLQVAARCLPADCPRRTLVLDGDPFQRLMETAESIGADVIVMSTHGRSGLAHVLLGGVTEKIVRHAPCPVFIVRRVTDGESGR